MDREDKPQQESARHREDFLERWSRRKLETEHDGPDVAAGELREANSPAPPADEPEQVLTDADMPPIESLDHDSDYTPFLSPGVSDDLRQQAMRKLFAQPDFNITDGLNDYDEDYTQFAGLGKIITHEMKRVLERELDPDKEPADSTEVLTGQAQESPAQDTKDATQAGDTDPDDIGSHAEDDGERDVTSG